MALVERHDAGAVAHLVLNAPERLNALSDQMLAELTAHLDDLSRTKRIRAVVLKGAGRAFCAGHDLREMTDRRQAEDGGAEAYADLFERCSGVMTRIRRLPQPVIAEVQGIAAAAGCQLVATCDLAVAAEDAQFAVNGVNIGLFCSTPMVALSRNVPRKRVFEMLVTGRKIDAAEALEIGLINRAVPAAELAETTQALAREIAGKLGTAVKLGKRAFYDQLEMGTDAAYDFCGRVMVENMLDEQTGSGIEAFLGKKTPRWTQ